MRPLPLIVLDSLIIAVLLYLTFMAGVQAGRYYVERPRALPPDIIRVYRMDGALYMEYGVIILDERE